MKFMNQEFAFNDIKVFAEQDKHSLIIDGPSGSGKTYIAKQYAKLLNIDDFLLIVPKVRDLRDTLDACAILDTNILICIENLDLANSSCAGVLLKCMEEPRSNMYFIITCNDLTKIPDTLISRSMTTTVNPPTRSDISLYMNTKYSEVSVDDNILLDCIKSFSDIDLIANMSIEQIKYFSNFRSDKFFTDTVANITWKLGHYEDKTDSPIDLVLRYILNSNKGNKHIVDTCIECMNALQKKRVAKHLILSKLAFELKYCE